MFSHLCRACKVELDPSQTVPLFEEYENVFLSRICNLMNLSLNDEDDLGENVCSKCAKTIMEFYTFHVMYTNSNRKLCQMLRQSIDLKTDSIVQTSLGLSDDAKHKCKKCSAGFKTLSLLRRHVSEMHRRRSAKHSVRRTNAEDEQLRWKCSQCFLLFRTRDSKNVHQRECRQLKAHRDATEMTEIKESVFVDYNDFDAGELHSGGEANNDDDFDDDYALLQTESKYKVGLPGMSDSNDGAGGKSPHESAESADTKIFSPVVSIKEEKLDFDDVPALKSESLGLEFDDSMAVLSGQSPNFRWKCKTCLRAFETRELLRIHRRSHVGARNLSQAVRTSWSCNICNAILSSRDKIRLHKRVNHPNVKRERRRNNDETKNWGDVGQYDCELCSKSFISKSKIRKHMDVHKNKGRLKRLCTVCGLELCSTYNLNNHIRTVHGRERKFHCTLCDRRFSHSHHLKTHMNRHDNIRPFQCDQCVKSFFDKTTLREHIKSVHLNLKQYACKICGRTFNRSGNMRAHMLKTHHLGDIGDVNRLVGMDSSINVAPIEDESDDFTQRLFPNPLGASFRSMVVKSSN